MTRTAPLRSRLSSTGPDRGGGGRGARAAIVVDLGFGDAGKGLVTDALVRAMGARLVVRFHGGAQAGHNVVTPDGRHHTFAQIGSGAFVPGVDSHLGDAFLLHPTALLAEAAHLARAGVPGALERLFVSERALVITPFHQAANRLRELARGASRHGSCGVGAGETVASALRDPEGAVRAADLLDPRSLSPRLRRLQDGKRDELRAEIAAVAGEAAADREIDLLTDPGVADRWLGALQPMFPRVTIVDGDWLRRRFAGPGAVVFEGAQGVLLDEWAGFHPYTTWSTCTFEGALALCAAHGLEGEVTRVGVLRTYAVRHGAGPFPTEDRSLDALLPERHNIDGPWQGRVRRGFPDMVLARYAAEVCGGVDALALTHLDALPRVPDWRACRAYRMERVPPALCEASPSDPGLCTRLLPPASRDLGRQAALSGALLSAEPVYEPQSWGGGEAGAERAIALFEEAVGAPAVLVSSGPSSPDVRWLPAGAGRV